MLTKAHSRLSVINKQWKSVTTYFAAFCLGLFDFVSCSWTSAGNYTEHMCHSEPTMIMTDCKESEISIITDEKKSTSYSYQMEENNT